VSYLVRVADHFTLRFQTATTERLRRRASAAGTKPRTLATRYVEEGLRHDDHPLIHFVDGPTGRRAAVMGTQFDVWEVIVTVRDNANDLAEAAEYMGVAPALVDAAVTYYGEFREEIDGEIALNASESERVRAAWHAGRSALAG
jgi:uncharacterized protein (DUF433 family)